MGSHDEKSVNRSRRRTSKLVCQDTVYKCSNLNRHSASCCSGSGIIFNAAVERDCYSRVCLMIDSNIQLPDKTFAGYNRRQVNDICTPSLCLHLNLSLFFLLNSPILTFFRLKWSAFNCSWISCSCRMACGCTLCRNPSRTPFNMNFFIFLTWVVLPPPCLLRYRYRYRYKIYCYIYV